MCHLLKMKPHMTASYIFFYRLKTGVFAYCKWKIWAYNLPSALFSEWLPPTPYACITDNVIHCYVLENLF